MVKQAFTGTGVLLDIVASSSAGGHMGGPAVDCSSSEEKCRERGRNRIVPIR